MVIPREWANVCSLFFSLDSSCHVDTDMGVAEGSILHKGAIKSPVLCLEDLKGGLQGSRKDQENPGEERTKASDPLNVLKYF